MARLLFLGASVSQLPGIRHARQAGHEIVACDGDPNAVAFGLCDVAEVVDFSDVERVVSAAKRERVEGVLAVCSDRAVTPAALVAAELGLPGVDLEVARAMTHKPTMRARLDECGLPQPAHLTLTAGCDPASTVSIRLPAVLKPADSGGQRGLFRIEHRQQLRRFLPETLAVSRSGQAMFEEFVEGTELNVLVAVRDGVPTLLTLSDRLRPTGRGFGVGWIHSFPSSLPAHVLAEAESVACAAVRCLGLRDGIAFPQLIASDEGVVVIEVAARIAAGQMADLVRHGTGIDLYEIAIAQALGRRVPDVMVEPKFMRPIAIRFLTAAPGVLPVGTVTEITRLERVRAADGVLDAGLYFDVGTTIGPLQVDADRRGYVIATGDDPATALRRADKAAEQLRVRVAPSGVLERRRIRRLYPAIVVTALLVATAGAFLISENAKLRGALVTGTRVDKTFSPVCNCSHDLAHIAFRLLHRARVTVGIVNKSTELVATLVHLRYLGAGLIHLHWNGRNRSGRPLADGEYFPQIVFTTLHRTLRLPSPITLDTDRPRVETATVITHRSRILVRYHFSEPAQAALLVDGRRAVLTRFTPVTGELNWSDRFRNDRILRRGRYRLALLAIDLAGNRSRPRPLESLVRG